MSRLQILSSLFQVPFIHHMNTMASPLLLSILRLCTCMSVFIVKKRMGGEIRVRKKSECV